MTEPGPRDEVAARLRGVVDAADLALGRLSHILGDLDDADPDIRTCTDAAKTANARLHENAAQLIERISGRPVS
ncbi:hypothetical protein [Mycolicibacterium vaccae]|uniref:hypothetical protein n=1 Tax=Mycolicibacterium vaccae TaxID=1810 RepID=UPI003CFF3CF1